MSKHPYNNPSKSYNYIGQEEEEENARKQKMGKQMPQNPLPPNQRQKTTVPTKRPKLIPEASKNNAAEMYRIFEKEERILRNKRPDLLSTLKNSSGSILDDEEEEEEGNNNDNNNKLQKQSRHKFAYADQLPVANVPLNKKHAKHGPKIGVKFESGSSITKEYNEQYIKQHDKEFEFGEVINQEFLDMLKKRIEEEKEKEKKLNEEAKKFQLLRESVEKGEKDKAELGKMPSEFAKKHVPTFKSQEYKKKMVQQQQQQTVNLKTPIILAPSNFLPQIPKVPMATHPIPNHQSGILSSPLAQSRTISGQNPLPQSPSFLNLVPSSPKQQQQLNYSQSPIASPVAGMVYSQSYPIISSPLKPSMGMSHVPISPLVGPSNFQPVAPPLKTPTKPTLGSQVPQSPLGFQQQQVLQSPQRQVLQVPLGFQQQQQQVLQSPQRQQILQSPQRQQNLQAPLGFQQQQQQQLPVASPNHYHQQYQQPTTPKNGIQQPSQQRLYQQQQQQQQFQSK